MVDPARVAVKVSDLGVCIRGAWLQEGVSFDCRAGEWTLIHRATGAGKSTLLRAINGLLQPTRGTIWTLDTKIPGRTRREARAVWRQTGTVLQEVALFETKTARENVELALRSAKLDGASPRRRAEEWLERLRLENKAAEYPCVLSGGERQRVALARAFAAHPRLLILDEPTSALDRDTARIVFEVVTELVEEGSTVLMSSHRVDEVFALCSQCIAVDKGRISSIERRATSAGCGVPPQGADGDEGTAMQAPEQVGGDMIMGPGGRD